MTSTALDQLSPWSAQLIAAKAIAILVHASPEKPMASSPRG
jgi:hypothetical protein